MKGVAWGGGSAIGLAFAGYDGLYSSIVATDRAATAQNKVNELKASNASGSELDAALAQAKEAQHDKALAIFNAGGALFGSGASLLQRKPGLGPSAVVGLVGLTANAYDTTAQYAGWKDLGALSQQILRPGVKVRQDKLRRPRAGCLPIDRQFRQWR